MIRAYLPLSCRSSCSPRPASPRTARSTGSGRALDQTGKNIRATVEAEVARGQIPRRSGTCSTALASVSIGTRRWWVPP